MKHRVQRLFLAALLGAGLALSPLSAAVSITAQPAAVTVSSGWNNIAFTVAATSTSGGTLSYRWHKNGSAIANGTVTTTLPNGRTIDTIVNGFANFNLAISNPRVVDGGSYTVIITDSSDIANPVTSSAALLTVTDDPPVVTAQSPASVAVTTGGRARLFFNVSGSRPATIQWKRNNVAIPGANGASFTSMDLDGVTSAQAGTYTVDITNAYGTATFTPVTLALAATPDPLDKWNWVNPNPQGNNLHGATVGNGLFVAVGRGGAVISTTDGQSGNIGVSGNSVGLGEVIFDPAAQRFVAVGGFSTIMTSLDARTWINRGLVAADDGYTGIATNGTGTLVVCGADFNFRPSTRALVRVSTNGGDSWSLPSVVPEGFAAITQFTSATYGAPGGNGHFVVVGMGGSLYFSTNNGANWTAGTSGTTQIFQRVAFANGRFVAVGNGGTLCVSTDGETFAAKTSNTGQNLFGVTYLTAASTWVAVGGAGTVLTSADNGETWTASSIPGANTDIYSIGANANIVMAVGRFGRLWSTATGATFSPANLLPVGDNSGSVQSAYSNSGNIGTDDGTNSINYVDWDAGSNQFIAVGANGNIHTFRNAGDNLQRRSAPAATAGFLTQWVRFGSRLLAAGSSTIYGSTDNAAMWTGTTVGTAQLWGLAVGNNRVVTVGGNGTIFTSTNGTSWTAATSNVSTILKKVAYANGRYVTVGGNDNGGSSITILTSDDGLAWTTRTAGTTGQLWGVDYANGVWIACGSQSSNGGGAFILRSTDNGVTWTRTDLPGANFLWSLRYVAGRWCAAGASAQLGTGLLAVSSDNGTTWSYKPLPAIPNNPSARGVAASRESVVVVGNDSTILESSTLPPVIGAQPAPATVAANGTLNLAVTASSSLPITYQWRYNGTPIGGATNSFYTLNNFQSGNAGTYDVVVTVTRSIDGVNYPASVTSAPAEASIAPAAGVAQSDGSFSRPQFWRYSLPGRLTAGPGGSVYATWTNGRTVNAVNGQFLGAVVKLNANGSVDTAFSAGTALSDAWAVVPLTDGSGKILVSGVSSDENNETGFTLFRVFRLNANGTRDFSYNSPVFTGIIRYMTLQPDGKLLVTPSAGSFTNNGGLSNLVRLNADGSQDFSFAIPTFNTTNPIFASIVVDGNNKILIGGTFTTVNGTARLGLARLNANGSLDTGFVPAGYTFTTPGQQVRGLGVQSTGKVLVAGSSLMVSGTSRPVIRLNDDGGLDGTFNLVDNSVLGVVPANAQRARLLNVITGDKFTVVSNKVVRFNANGTEDDTFAPATLSTEAFWIDTLADGSVLVAPEFGTTVNGTAVSAPVRLTNTGALDTTFTPGKFQTAVYPNDFAILPDSRILVWGNFDTANTGARPGMVRLAASGGVDSFTLSGVPNLLGIANATVLNDGRILAGTILGAYQSTATSGISRFNADGTADGTFSLDSSVNAAALDVLPDNRILTWSLTPSNLLSGGLFFKRLTANGAIDTSFTGLGSTAFGAVYRDGSNVITEIVQGQFRIVGHYDDGRALAIATTPNGTYAAGSTSLPVTILRLNANGTLDTGFTAPSINWSTSFGVTSVINDPVRSVTGQWNLRSVGGSPFSGVVPQPDGGVIVYGAFTSLGGRAAPGIARLTNTGAVDTSFSVGTGPELRNRTDRAPLVQSINTAPDGKIWIAGTFDTFGGRAASGLVRLNADGTVDPTFATGLTYRQFLGSGTKVGFGPAGEVIVAGTFRQGGEIPTPINRLVSTVQPAIVTHPVNTSASLGGMTSFSVAVTPGLQAAYQWFRNGAALAGANRSSLALANIQAADLGSYTVRVTTALGSVTSNFATLIDATPGAAPVITTQPQSTSLNVGASGSLSVTATGTSLSYQWRKFGQPIAGATAASLPLNNASLTDAGLYDVVVASGLTTAISQPAQLSVFPVANPGIVRPRANFARFEQIGNATTIIPLTGGAFYAIGNFTRVDGLASNGIARFLSTGAVDSSFSSVRLTGTINAAVLQSDGKLVVGGAFRLAGTVSRNYIARLNTNGTLDTTFDPGTGFNAPVNALALQTDGKIVAGGAFTNYNGTVRLNLARLTATGALDTAFGLTTGLNGTVSTLALQTDGKIVAAGVFNSYSGTAVGRIARFLGTDGTLDTAFNTAAGAGFNSTVASLVLDASGKIVVGGQFSTFNTVARSNLARLSADGALDTAFLPANAGPNGNVNSVALDSTGNIIIGGSFNSYAGTARQFVTRVSSVSGTLDLSFASTGGLASPAALVAVLTDGKIVASGNFNSAGGSPRHGLAKFSDTGALDTGLNATLRQPGFVYALAAAPNSKWLVGGSFAYVNDAPISFLARLNDDGSVDTSYTPGSGPNSPVYALALQPDNRIIIGGNFGFYNGTSRAGVARLNPEGTLDQNFAIGTGFNSNVLALALQADGKLLVGGNFTAFNGVTTGVNRLARLNPDGTLDTAFATATGTGFPSTVNALRVQPDRKILVGGSFATFNAVSSANHARLLSDGTLDTAYTIGTGFNSLVNTLLAQPDGRLYAGGFFSSYAGVTRQNIAALTTTGAPDTAFAPPNNNAFNGNVSAFALQGDGKIVTLGSFTAYSATPRLYLARLNPNATLDTAFAVPTLQFGAGISNQSALALRNGGSLLVGGGRFDFAEGVFAGLVLLEAAPVPQITAAPTAQAADPAGTATFMVTATGDSLAYQWQKNGTPIAGANASTLTLNNVTTSDYAAYSVVVSNPYGSATSAAAALNPVNPLILDQPFSLRAVAGGPAILRVSALGSGTLTYLWKKGANAIDGATSDRLEFTELTAADAGTYSVVVTSSNPTGLVTSQTATLTVLPADPLFWTQVTASSTEVSPSRTIHDGSGGIYLAWTSQLNGFDMVGGKFAGQLARVRESDGSLDESFKLDASIHRVGFVAKQTDGKLLLAVNTGDASTVIRVTATGAVDSTFKAPFFNYSIRWLTIQPDGKVLLSASDNSIPNAPQSVIQFFNSTILRLNTDGAIDTTFAAAALNGNSAVFWPPALDAQGRIHLVGNFNTVNGTSRPGVVRLSSAGVIDPAFAATMPSGFFYNQQRTVSFQTDGKIVVTGTNVRYTARGTQQDPVVAIRFNTDGSFDTTFAQPLRSSTGINVNVGAALRAVLMQPDNKFLAVSDRLLRFNADGSLDTTFTPRVFGNEAFWFSKGADGRYYVPGIASVMGNGISLPTGGIAVLNASGTPDLTFQSGGWGRTSYPSSSNVLSDGGVFLAGNYNRIGDTPAYGVAKVSASGTRSDGAVLYQRDDLSWNLLSVRPPQGAPTPDQPFATVTSAGSDKSYIILGDSLTGAARLYRLDAAGQPEATYVPQVPTSIALGSANPHASPDGKLILASSGVSAVQALAGTTAGGLVRLSADGTPDSGFTASLTSLARVDRAAGTNAVTQITLGAMRVAQVLADGRLLVIFSATDGNIRVQRLLANGNVDPSFNAPSFGQAVGSSGFTSLLTDPVTGFNGQFNLTTYGSSNAVTSAVQAPDGKVYVAGNFYADGLPHGLARLNANGSPDLTFTGSGIDYTANPAASAYVSSLAIDATGRLYVAGRLDRFNSIPVTNGGLFRLRADGTFDPSWNPALAILDYPAVDVKLSLAADKLYVLGTVGAPTDTTPKGLGIVALDTPPPVTFTFSPRSLAVVPGNTLNLAVRAYSLESLTYQWSLNGTPIDGATSATYTVANFQPANAGTYTVVATTATSRVSVTSAAGVVTAAPPEASYLADPGFTRPMFRQSAWPLQVAIGPDSKYYVTWNNGGSLTGANHQRVGVIVRLNANGTVDNTFQPGTVLADALNIQFEGGPSDFKLLVGGVAPNEGSDTGQPVYRVFRLNSDGTRDTTYNSPQFIFMPRFMTRQADGKLLVVPGNAGNGFGFSTLARLNINGSLDGSFQNPSFDGSNFIFAPPVIDSDGKVLIAGTFQTVNGTTRPGVARLNANGSLDTTFAPSGFTFGGQIRGLALQTQGANAGKILIAGGQLRVVGDTTNTNRAVLRLSATGVLDTTFGNPSQSTAGMNPRPRLLVKSASDDGFTLIGATAKRFTAEGAVDTSFTSPVLSAETFWMAQHADGRTVFTMDLGTTVNGAAATSVVRLTATGAVDGTFTPPPFQTEVYNVEVFAGANSRPTVIGPFNTVNGTPRAAVARFNVDGTLDTLGLSGVSNLLGADGGYVRPDGRIIIGARIGTNILSPTTTDPVLLFNLDGARNTTFALDATVTKVIQSDSSVQVLGDSGLLITSNSAQQIIDGSAFFQRLNADGSRHSAFTGIGTALFGRVYRDNTGAITQIVRGEFRLVGVYPDGRALVAVTSTSPGAYPQNVASLDVTLLRFLADGTPDTTFTAPTVAVSTTENYRDVTDTGATTTVNVPVVELNDLPYVKALVQTDGKILVAGDFRSLGGVVTKNFARLSENGSIDTSFSVGTGAEIRRRATADGNGLQDVEIAPDGKIWIVGAFDTFNGYGTPGIVRLNTDGGVDTSFATDISYRSFVLADDRDTPPISIAFGADGSVYLSGSYAKSGEVFPYALTRLVKLAKAPAITTQPASATVTAGQPATFTVVASGTPVPTYQWQKDGTNISTATSSTYTIASAQAGDQAVYSVIVTNSQGAVTSTFATLTVNPPPVAPSVTTAPASQTVTAGTPVTFAVVAAGTAPFTYQWQRNSVDITNATNATLTLANPQVADSGSFTVIIRNSVSTITSAAATLTVNPLAVAPVITAQPVSQTVRVGDRAAITIAATGSGTVDFVFDSSWNGPPLTVINGGTDGGRIARVELPSVQPSNAGTYTIRVSNTAGAVTSNPFTLTVLPALVAPAIVAPPDSQTVTAGTVVTFGVTATGTAPLAYLWQRNGVPVSGATASLLTFNNPQVADSGSYTVIVSNAAGSVTSGTATLIVRPAGTPPALVTSPASQTVTAGANVTFTAAATGTAPLVLQWRKNGVDLVGSTGTSLVLNSVQTSATGSYSVKVTNDVGFVVSAPATLTVNPVIPAPVISGATAVATQLGTTFSYQISASNTPTSYAATAGPAGLSINTATGLITGTPTTAGTFTITLSATNAGGTGTAPLTITVVAPVPVITSVSSASGRVGSALGYTVTATNTPTSFAATGLPAGLTLNTATGVISGTPTAAGSVAVALTATNSGGTSAPYLLTLGIAASVNVPVVTGDATATGKVGDAFVYAIAASNTPTSFSATGVPAGLSLNTATGLITGTPSAAGNFTMGVAATNAAGTSTALNVFVTIAPAATAPVITSSGSATATAGTPFSYQIAASNTPTSFTATGLPAGLTVSASTGLISGTPTAAATSAVLLGATNAGGTGSAALLLTVEVGLSAPVITGSPAARGTVGTAFTYAAIASNSPTSFAATGLPAGLALNSGTGIISGTPTTAGTFPVSLTAANAAGTGAAFPLTITVASAALAPVITSDATALGTQGLLFTYQIAASNGPITGYGATGLPAGLSLNPLTGVITGTPTTAASSAVVLTASNAAGTSTPLGLLLTIQAGAQVPVVTSSRTAVGTQGRIFTYLVTANNMPGTTPLPPGNGYTATGLPAGIALNPSNGVINGLPTATGRFTVSLTATNDAGTSAVRTLVITVNAAPNAPIINSGNTAAAIAGTAFTYRMTASGSPNHFDVVDRPAWLSINTATGVLSGTAPAPGTYTVRLTAANSTGSSNYVTLTISVSPAAGSPVVTSTLTAGGTATAAFTYQIGAGPGPITGYLVGGSLPDGLSLDSTTGVISGTPTVPGTYNVPVSAVNAAGIGGAKTVVLTIEAAPGSPAIETGPTGLSSTRLILGVGGYRRASATGSTLTATGIVNVPFVYQIVASNNPTAYLASDLPDGLALNPGTGLISGTPTVAGTFNARVGATNSIGVGATVPLVITISPPPTAPAITSSLATSGTVGAAFTYQAAASNTPTSYNATGLPTGLALDSSTGAITGTPTAPGVSHVSLSANNSAGTGTVSDLVITIAAAASAPAVTSSASAGGTVGAAFTYQITGSNTPTSYTAAGLPPGVTLNAATGAITGAPTVDGQFSAQLSAANASGASAPFTLTITVAPSAATSVITSTASATVVAGGNFTYLISASNSPVSYNISALPAGLTGSPTGGLITGSPTTAGSYTVTLSANNLAGTGPAMVLTLTVTPNDGTPEPTPVQGARLINLSTRGEVGTDANVLIVGFVITGTTPKPVMIRGVGPTLGGYGVPGTLPDPQLTLYNVSNTQIGQNNNWATAGDPATLTTHMTRLGAFTLGTGSLDSVLYTTLDPGIYSAVLSGNGVTPTGVGIVEIYDGTVTATFASTSPRIVNVSTRGRVGTEANILIAGFVLTGDQPRQVLIRGVGPTLGDYGVPLTLSDPTIRLLNNATGAEIKVNDNWGTAGDGATISAASAVVGAFPLASGSKDAAMIATLQPGVYGVQVSGVAGATGVAIVEVYELP